MLRPLRRLRRVPYVSIEMMLLSQFLRGEHGLSCRLIALFVCACLLRC